MATYSLGIFGITQLASLPNPDTDISVTAFALRFCINSILNCRDFKHLSRTRTCTSTAAAKYEPGQYGGGNHSGRPGELARYTFDNDRVFSMRALSVAEPTPVAAYTVSDKENNEQFISVVPLTRVLPMARPAPIPA